MLSLELLLQNNLYEHQNQKSRTGAPIAKDSFTGIGRIDQVAKAITKKFSGNQKVNAQRTQVAFLYIKVSAKRNRALKTIIGAIPRSHASLLSSVIPPPSSSGRVAEHKATNRAKNLIANIPRLWIILNS